MNYSRITIAAAVALGAITLLTINTAADGEKISRFGKISAESIEAERITLTGGYGSIEMVADERVTGIWLSHNTQAKGQIGVVVEPQHESPYFIMYDPQNKPKFAIFLQDGEPTIQTYREKDRQPYKFHDLIDSLDNNTKE